MSSAEPAAKKRVVVSFGIGSPSKHRSFPPKRESNPSAAHFQWLAPWIPAYSSKPGAGGTRNLINKVNPVGRSGRMVSEGVKQPTEETPRAATNHSRGRSTTSERLSSGAGRSDPKRILRCGQLDDSPIRAAPGPSPRLLPSPTRRIPMNTPTSNPPVVAWVGLDWADQRHEIRLQAAGSPRLESFSVEQKPEVFQAWVAELRARFP